jgi:hypothetical protein
LQIILFGLRTANMGELTQRVEALAARVDKARISEKALAQVSASLDEEWTKAEAHSR